MADAHHASFLPPIILFCGAAVAAVPLFKRLGLGAVVGYLVAGVLIGPSVLALVADPRTITQIAEIGVVMLLFIVGLEMEPQRLVSMRRDIMGLGAAQLVVTTLILAGIGVALGLSGLGAALAAIAFSLSATSIAIQLLEERGDLPAPYGQKTFAVLLFQDMSIAPILAVAPLLAGSAAAGLGGVFSWQALQGIGLGLAAVAALVGAGLYLLNPLFRLLAKADAREVLTAAALLIVLGSALVMEAVGLSMALGAFLAGMLLAESAFKHQLEADIEPFRGLLLGLFFMGVGMSIDLATVLRDWLIVVVAVPVILGVKIAVALAALRWSGAGRRDAVRAAILLAPAGEFGFVLLPLAASLGLITADRAGLFLALAALTMAAGPLMARGLEFWLARRDSQRQVAEPEPDAFDGAQGRVLVIGSGRFGQVVNQILLAQNVDVTVIDKDIDMIRSAARFGFKVYYGDGARLDVLRAAGADKARVIAVCVDDKATATRIVGLAREAFPATKIYARAYDRGHAIELAGKGVDFHMRETLMSALSFGRATLEAMGVEPERAAEVEADVRKRDAIRLSLQQSEGLMGGHHLLHGVTLKPEPLIAPKQKTQALTDETRRLIERGTAS